MDLAIAGTRHVQRPPTGLRDFATYGSPD
jgi:hypothetical protein